MRARDAWLCFVDEAGQLLRPPRTRTWARRGRTPALPVRTTQAGRVSLAGTVCRKPDFAVLLDAAHQQLGGNIVLVWDNYVHHVNAAMRALIATQRWLTVFRLPPYAPDLNPAEGVWSHLKRSLANLAPFDLDGFIAQIGFITTPPRRHPEPKESVMLLAHLFQAVTTAAEQAAPAPAGLIPLTLNEIRHLSVRLVIKHVDRPVDRLHWSWWRRRHQYRGRGVVARVSPVCARQPSSTSGRYWLSSDPPVRFNSGA
ncbi:transposase [Saccharothrix syringae]|uniref:transposase n=1 Tax=Saccharothrix syringae TaxID=103733 RepID=UPI0007C44DC3|nr:transposase [Saccharothrix syringae]